MRRYRLLLAALLLWPMSAYAATPVDGLYQQHCASCHHAERLGGSGPALLPENLTRLSPQKVEQVIRDGRAATQMPGFATQLTDEQIQQLTALVRSPLPQIPTWDMAAMTESHQLFIDRRQLPEQPVHHADPLNLFIVIEQGDHHATILDGDRLESIHRFATPIAVHGGPKFSPDGRFVFIASRNGWIMQFDLYSLQVVAQVRAGINTRNLAISDDGTTVMVANYLPHTLVVLDAHDLRPRKVIPVTHQQHSSRVSAVYTAAPRHSFIVALKDLQQVWEIPYSNQAKPVITALVHDYRAESGEDLPIDKTPFPIRRIHLNNYLDDFFFDASYTHLLGASRDGGRGEVVHLDVGRPIASVDLPGLPHLGSGITWPWRGTTVMATPNLKEPVVSIIDMKSWQVVQRIATAGPGFFLRSHEQTPYAWVDASLSSEKDKIQLIDKETLTVAHTLQPIPGKPASHVEFTRDGRFALVSIQSADGALVIYDAHTLTEVKRLPMNMPSGKYNVANKINRSSGTSH
ncbi:MAG: c-type cytochrome [Magnetococcales bacterium]|nr:c-type cytochrome [Magnetococcales bacterium]